jgi:hypothetical protein
VAEKRVITSISLLPSDIAWLKGLGAALYVSGKIPKAGISPAVCYLVREHAKTVKP